MSFQVIGAGLVGSYLGAAAGAAWATRRSGPVHERVQLPAEIRDWNPSPTPPAGLPALIATRCHQTPWELLPKNALAAQNGLGQPCPVAVCFFAIDRKADRTLISACPPRIVVGPLAPQWTPVLNAWRRAGITVEQTADPRPAQWEKAILNATVGPLCLATGRSMQSVWRDAALRRLVEAATSEGERIAHATGVSLPAGLSERTATFFTQLADHQPSILKDPGELPWILGALRSHAQRLTVPCPALDQIAVLAATVLAATGCAPSSTAESKH